MMRSRMNHGGVKFCDTCSNCHRVATHCLPCSACVGTVGTPSGVLHIGDETNGGVSPGTTKHP